MCLITLISCMTREWSSADVSNVWRRNRANFAAKVAQKDVTQLTVHIPFYGIALYKSTFTYLLTSGLPLSRQTKIPSFSLTFPDALQAIYQTNAHLLIHMLCEHHPWKNELQYKRSTGKLILLSCHNQISVTTQIPWPFPDFGPFPWLFTNLSRIPWISRFPEIPAKW